MTQSKRIDRLSRYYAEYTAKNPKDTIHENMVKAVSHVPVIAAAPDLLEALVHAESLIREILQDRLPADLQHEAEEDEVLIMAKTAIAKARGES